MTSHFRSRHAGVSIRSNHGVRIPSVPADADITRDIEQPPDPTAFPPYLINPSHFDPTIRAPLYYTAATSPTDVTFSAGYGEGALVFWGGVNGDHKLYRHNGTVFTIAVDAADITVNQLNAGQIAAGAIGASHLQVGGLSSRNLLVNGGFRDGTEGWTAGASGPTLDGGLALWDRYATDWTFPDGDTGFLANGAKGGTAYIRTTSDTYGSVGYMWIDQVVPVIGGEWYSLTAMLGFHRLSSGGVELHVYDSTGTGVGYTYFAGDASKQGGTSLANWSQISGSYAMPSTARTCRIRLLGVTPVTAPYDGYVFADQVWFGRGRFPQKYQPQESQGVASSTGDVVIDASGITIRNGRIALLDESGASVLMASGFGGSWSDFVRNGLYNGSFNTPASGSLAAGSTVSPAPGNVIPYWGWQVSSSGCSVAYGGSLVDVDLTSASGWASLTSSVVPVRNKGRYQTRLRFTMNGDAGGGTVTSIQPKIHWYNGSLGFISTSTLTAFTSNSPTVNTEYTSNPVEAPINAYYAAVAYTVSHISGSVYGRAYLYQASIAEALSDDQSIADLSTASLHSNGTLAVDGVSTLTGGISSYDGDAYTTYTPTVTNGGTATYTTRTGWYYTIGKMVFVNIRIVVNAVGTGGGTIGLDLPLAPDVNLPQWLSGYYSGMVTISPTSSTSIGVIDGSTSPHLSAIRGSSGTALTRAHFVTGAGINFTGWYLAA